MQFFLYNNKPKFHLARHNTTRYSPCKSRGVLCGTCRAARRDTHNACSGVSPQRDLGWTCQPVFFQKLFIRLMQIQSTKTKLNASTTASSSSDTLEQSLRDTYDTSCVSCRDVAQQVEFGLYRKTNELYRARRRVDSRL